MNVLEYLPRVLVQVDSASKDSQDRIGACSRELRLPEQGTETVDSRLTSSVLTSIGSGDASLLVATRGLALRTLCMCFFSACSNLHSKEQILTWCKLVGAAGGRTILKRPGLGKYYPIRFQPS